MCRTHKFSVPEKMESMAGSNQEIEAVLDIYSLEKKNHLDYVDFEQYSVKEKDRATSRVRGRVAGENGPPRPASSGKATSNQRNASVGSIRASAKDFPRFQ